MVIVKLTIEHFQIALEYQIEDTISTVLQQVNQIIPQLKAIQWCELNKETITNQIQQKHLKEMFLRTVRTANGIFTKELIDIQSVQIVINDIKRVFQIIFNQTQDQFEEILQTESHYTKIICCKKELDHSKTFKELYGNNTKLSLKMIIET